MKRALAAAFLLLLLGTTALAAEEDAYIGALARASKAVEEESPYIVQCELGSLGADAVREATGADIALVPSADITGCLPQGLLTREDIEAVLRRDEAIVCTRLSPAKLYSMLENAVSHMELDTVTERIKEGSEVYDGFCQVSGITFRYDVSAPVGERICEVTRSDGETLLRTDETERLTVAATESLSEGTTTGLTLSDAMAGYVNTHNSVPTDSSQRIRMIGARNRVSGGLFSPGVLVAGVAVIGLFLIFWRRRYANYKDEYGYTK